MDPKRNTSQPESSSRWSIVLEVSAGIVRLPVSRIDSREVLVDSTIRLQVGQRYELIVERPDGHAELIHAEVLRRNDAGLLLRWKPAHPRELSALERLFGDEEQKVIGSILLPGKYQITSRMSAVDPPVASSLARSTPHALCTLCLISLSRRSSAHGAHHTTPPSTAAARAHVS